jgi:hypothetical protein
MNPIQSTQALPPQGEGNKRNLKDNPFYFGHYLNMARHNCYKILVHLTEKHLKNSSAEGISEDNLRAILLLNDEQIKLNPIEKAAIAQGLMYHFPFLAYLENRAEEDKKPIELNLNDTQQNMIEALYQLHELRNAYMHYNNVKPIAPLSKTKGKPFEMLKVYAYGYKKIMERYSHAEKGFKSEHITHLSPETGKHLPPDIKTAQPNDPYYEKALTYFICLFLEPADASVFLSRLYGFHDTRTPEYRATRALYMMFCCRPPARKLESSDIVLDMLNELGRVPKPLFNLLSEADQEALIEASMIYDAETEEQTYNKVSRSQDRFPYFALRYFDDALPNGKRFMGSLYFQIHIGKYLKKPTYQKPMNSDLRDRNLLGDVHTFGDLSHYRNMYDALNQDNKEEKRILKPELFNENWCADATKVLLRPEIKQFSPQYNFGENTIGFLIKDKTNGDKINILPDFTEKAGKNGNILSITQTRPTAFISTYELQSLFFYQYLHIQGHIEKDATVFLNIYINKIKKLLKDIQSGQFKILNDKVQWYKKEIKAPIKKRDEKYEIFQERLKKYELDVATNKALIEKRRKALSLAIETQYGIKRTALPDTLMEYLLGYAPPQYKTLALAKLNRKLKDVASRLKKMGEAKGSGHRFKSKKTEKDKPKIYPNLGEIATYLAEDIVFLMPPKLHTYAADKAPVEQKINNDQFRMLQYSLAMFGAEKENLVKYFEELCLVQKDSPTRHPFLRYIDISACHGIVDFYIAYLNEKQSFIDYLKDYIKNNNDEAVKDKYGYILPINMKAYKDRQYDTLPICFPRGIFKDPIIKALMTKKPELGIKESDNIVYALSKYLDNEKQGFYNKTHWIKPSDKDSDTEGVLIEVQTYLDELNKKIDQTQQDYEKVLAYRHRQAKYLGKGSEEALEAKEYELAKKHSIKDLTRKYIRTIEKEKEIRFFESNDRALWLMSIDLLKQKHPELKKIETKKLSELDILLNSEVTVVEELNTIKVQDTTLRIKNYGRLRSLMKDRRLDKEGLPSYFEQNAVIPYETLKVELKCYDDRRDSFSDLIYAFEKAVAKNNNLKGKLPILGPVIIDGETKQAYDHPNYMKNYGILKTSKPDIRNYFDHSVYMAIASTIIQDTTLKEKYLKKILRLRNKIFHNQYPEFRITINNKPEPTWIKKEVEALDSNLLITNRLFDIAEGYYRQLKDMVEAYIGVEEENLVA